jgi:hypothetical protein
MMAISIFDLFEALTIQRTHKIGGEFTNELSVAWPFNGRRLVFVAECQAITNVEDGQEGAASSLLPFSSS